MTATTTVSLAPCVFPRFFSGGSSASTSTVIRTTGFQHVCCTTRTGSTEVHGQQIPIRRGYKSFSQPQKSPTPRWVKRLLLLSEKHRSPSRTRIDVFSDDPSKGPQALNRQNDLYKVLRDDPSLATSQRHTVLQSVFGSTVTPVPPDEQLRRGLALGAGTRALGAGTAANDGDVKALTSSGVGRKSKSLSRTNDHGPHVVSKTSTNQKSDDRDDTSQTQGHPRGARVTERMRQQFLVRTPTHDVWTAEECATWDVKPSRPILGSARTGLIGYKMGMMCLYDDWGQRHTITVIKVDRARVCASKTIQSHGYSAVQIGIGYKPVERQRKSELGHFMKAGVGPKDVLHEFRVSPDCVLPVGHRLSVRHFVPGQWCFLSGMSQARGWQGVMRRWGFAGGRRANAEKQHRAPGSIGVKGDCNVWSGKKMAGHMGPDPRCMNVKIFRIDARRDLLFLRATVPGRKGAVVKISDGRAKTGLKNAHIKLPYPTFCPEPGVRYPCVMDQPVKQYDPFLYPDIPFYQPDD